MLMDSRYMLYHEVLDEKCLVEVQKIGSKKNCAYRVRSTGCNVWQKCCCWLVCFAPLQVLGFPTGNDAVIWGRWAPRYALCSMCT